MLYILEISFDSMVILFMSFDKSLYVIYPQSPGLQNVLSVYIMFRVRVDSNHNGKYNPSSSVNFFSFIYGVFLLLHMFVISSCGITYFSSSSSSSPPSSYNLKTVFCFPHVYVRWIIWHMRDTEHSLFWLFRWCVHCSLQKKRERRKIFSFFIPIFRGGDTSPILNMPLYHAFFSLTLSLLEKSF